MKLYALLGAVCLLGACHDDFGNEGGIKVIPGEEIQFGATAHFEDGDNTTRTVYGDIVGNQIEVNWVAGEDRIQIASPHTTGVDVAEYTVTGASDADLANGKDKSTAMTLQRIGEAGLQWTNEEEYEFYAMYPSHNQLKEVVTEVEDTKTYGLKTSYDEQEKPVGTMVGYLPLRQDPKDLNGLTFTNDVCVVEPDMRLAYMVAKEHYIVPEDRVITDTTKIQLNFSSLVTALQFDITANTIGTQTNSDGQITNQIYITDLTLYSASGNDVCGKFEYVFPQGTDKDIKNGKFKSLNETTGYSRISMSFGEGIPLSAGDAIEATFFLLPSVEKYPAGDLKLVIHYMVNGFMQTKTATINKEITARKKYYFKDMLMPPVPANVSAAVWFQALDPNTYISQVSIPVASNVFALETIESTSTKFSAKSCQQVKSFTELWDMGVRGFEIQTQKAVNNSNVSDGTLSLGTAHFTCDENRFESSTYNFNYAFTTLVDKLRPIVDDSVSVSKECLILVCTYQASNDGYNPHNYVSQLINYLNAYLASEHAKTRGLTQSNFIQITSGTTAGELQGNIAIVIRPGDDDRYESDNTTATIDLGAWAGNLTLIQDWGTAFDVWDRRYEGVARESTFETLYVMKMAGKRTEARPQIEDWLWGVSSSNGSYTKVDGEHDFNDGTTFPTAKKKFDYAHAMKGNTEGTAYVQEWARVSPGIERMYTEDDVSVGDWGRTTRYLWVYWPSSIDEKKTAIDGLFELSVDEKGEASNNLYINSLSGYYIDSDIKEGLYPYKETFRGGDNTVLGRGGNFAISNQGEGGDHVTLAHELNSYVFSILKGDEPLSSTGEYLADGPWGLVMMEHIGNTAKPDDKSVDLVNLIVMNNFKFPLATKPNGDTPPPATRDVAVSFSNEPANPSGEIH